MHGFQRSHPVFDEQFIDAICYLGANYLRQLVDTSITKEIRDELAVLGVFVHLTNHDGKTEFQVAPCEQHNDEHPLQQDIVDV